MDFEASVAEYLSAWGSAFIAPQYDVRHNAFSQTGGSSPDFVVIDFQRRDVAAVEVSSAYDLSGLIARINDREKRWYEPIRHRLVIQHVIDDSWPRLRTIAFVRAERKTWFQGQVSYPDVTIVALEEATFPYEWFDRRSKGLPNKLL